VTLSQSPRILITRLSAIGDCVLTMPLLCALREQWPQAYLAWAVERAAASLLRGHDSLDELIVLPQGWLKSPSKMLQLRGELLRHRFEIAIDPQSLTKSSVVAWLSNAEQRLGFARPRGRELSVWLNRQLVRPAATHLVDAQLELLQPLGVASAGVSFRLPTNAAAESAVEELLRALHLGCHFAVINPGAGWDSRLWPAMRYGRVAKALGQRQQLPSLVVWAGAREHVWAREVVAYSGGHALLAPPTTLPELAAVLRRARMFLGSDTGPMHIAAAVGTPCVTLFGTTRPEASGPYGPCHVAVQERYQSGTSRQRRSAGNDAMREIRVERVADACEELLARPVAVRVA